MIDPSLLAPERVRPLRRDEFNRLAEIGCFADERVELLEGAMVAMSSASPPHAYTASLLGMLFVRAVGRRAIVRPRCPLGAGTFSQPEPDLALVEHRDFSRAHPTRAFLVVEVADSSLRKDRLIKRGLYARAGVPEYWIVNLDERVVEVHRDPRDGAYATVTTHGEGQVLRPAAFDDIEVPIAEVLPAPG
jgi:Uma2 family endonuclease